MIIIISERNHTMEDLISNLGTPAEKLKKYQACVNEFDQLKFDDVYVRQIRDELASLEKIVNTSDIN